MMLDYKKAKQDAERRKEELQLRLLQIPEERSKLDREVEAIKRELIGLDQILDGLDFATSDATPVVEPTGFTDKIRKLLSETPLPLVPTQIRDKLEESGVTGSSSKNLLISVHTVLERIDGELDKVKRTDGKIAFKRKLPWAVAHHLASLAGLSGLDLPGGAYGRTVVPEPPADLIRKTLGQRIGERTVLPPPGWEDIAREALARKKK